MRSRQSNRPGLPPRAPAAIDSKPTDRIPVRYSQRGMATTPNKNMAAGPRAGSQTGFVYLPLIAGWLIPGAGHFLLRKWYRGALLAASILGMFALGIAMQGKLYSPARTTFWTCWGWSAIWATG